MNPPRLWPLTDCTANYRPVLSSERAPQNEEQSNCPVKEGIRKIFSWAPRCPTPGHTDWLTVGHNFNSTQGLPLWSSGESSWLQIQRSGFDFRYYQIFWEVVGLDRGLLSLVTTIEELLGRGTAAAVLITEITAAGEPPRWLSFTPLFAKVVTNFADKLRFSVGVVRSRTHATEFVF
jgi:hypothetical protein